MTGKTHRAGGAFVAVVGYVVLRDNGFTLKDSNDYIQLLAMYPFAIWGSLASDLDHNPDSIPCKDIFSVFVNKLLHLTRKSYKRYSEVLKSDSYDAKTKRRVRNSIRYRVSRFLNARHRSWQTHSDLTFLALMLAVMFLFFRMSLTSTDTVLVNIMSTGVLLGLISHLVLDALTTDGIHLLLMRAINLTILGKSKFQLPEKLHLVPRSKFFSCESKWETFIRWLLNSLTVFSFGYFIFVIDKPQWSVSLLHFINSLVN